MDELFHHSNETHHHVHHAVVHESAGWLVGLYRVWFYIFGAVALVALLGLLQPTKGTAKRASYYLSFAINAVAAMAYFAMAHGQGRSFVTHDGGLYEVFWARYVDWSITTPLLLTHLVLFAGLAWQQWVFVFLCDVAMIVTGLIGNLDPEASKWGWFVFGCAFQIIIAVELFGPARKNALSKSNVHAKVYNAALIYLMAVWAVYPVVWALEHGTRHMSVSTAGLLYAILDLLAKPVYSVLLFFLHVHLEQQGVADGGDATSGLLESGGEA